MKRNYYTIEKYKQSFDKEGNEILTPIDVIDGQRTLEKENALNAALATSSFTSTGALDRALEDSGSNYVFDDYTIAIAPYKFATKGAWYSSVSSDWTTDDTSEDLTKGILGTRFTGEDQSVRSGTDTEVHTMRCRFSPPATQQRTINTLFLATMYTFSTSQDNPFFSTVVLDAPCYQETDEVLIITYRYVYPRLAIAEKTPFFTQNPEFADFVASRLGMHSSVDLPLGRPYEVQYQETKGIYTGNIPISDAGWDSVVNNSYLDSYQELPIEGCLQVSASLTVNDYIGKFLSTFCAQNSRAITSDWTNDTNTDYDLPIAEVALRRPQETVIQNIFNKVISTTDLESAIATPFYSSAAAGSSIGTLTFSDDLSSGDTSYNVKGAFAELFRAEITTGGAAGVAEYKIARRAFSSFESAAGWAAHGGSYVLGGGVDNDVASRRMITNNTRSNPYGIVDMIHQMAASMQPLGLGEVMVLCQHETEDQNGLFIHSLNPNVEGFPIKVDSSTLPAFTATDIRGFCTAEDGTIFVACADTGLWKLTRNVGDAPGDMTAALVTTPATTGTSCHAVNFGRYGNRFNSDARLVAMFGNELVVSDDGGSNWTLYNASSTPAFAPSYDPDEVTGIAIHPDHLDVIIVLHADAGFKYSSTGGTGGTTTTESNAIQWDGDTETVYTATSLGGASHAVEQSYGGSNKNYRPLTNTGTYRWAQIDRTSTTYAGVYGFDTIDSRTTLTSSYTYNTSLELVYDEVNDDSYVISYWGQDGYNLSCELSTDIVNDTLKANYLAECRNSLNAFMNVGRGLYIGAGSLLYADNIFDNRVTSSKGCQEGNARPFHFFLTNNPEKDFYSDNRLNLWHKYGWDGSSWVEGNSSSKVSSALTEDIVEGLQITFTNDTTLPSDPSNFILGECWDTFAFDGIVKDDYTALSFDALLFGGVNAEGDEFSPTTVPANSQGQSRQAIGLEYWGGHEDGSSTAIFFGADFITQSSTGGSFSYLDLESNLIPIGPEVDSTADFTYEFKLSGGISDNFIDDGTASTYTVPSVYLTNDTNRSTLNPGDYEFGIRPSYSTSSPESLFLHLYTQDGSYVEQIEITDYNPNSDIFKFEQDVSAGTFRLLHNDVEVYTQGLLTGDIRLYYAGVGSLPNTSISLSLYGHSTDIWDIYLTTNHTRLMSKIGNGTDSGAFADDYGRVAPLEYIYGIKKIYLDGVEAPVIYDHLTIEPPAGQVKLNIATGELVFNSSDAGKVITGSWRYLPAVNA